MSEEFEGDEFAEKKAAEPNPEPEGDPSDAHTGPLDDPEDARFLDPADPRRMAVERERGEPFREDDTEEGDEPEEGE
jgi:hypothetical protein